MKGTRVGWENVCVEEGDEYADRDLGQVLSYTQRQIFDGRKHRTSFCNCTLNTKEFSIRRVMTTVMLPFENNLFEGCSAKPRRRGKKGGGGAEATWSVNIKECLWGNNGHQ